MQKHVFRKLARTLTAKTGLSDSKHVTLDEAFGLFLHMLVANNTTEQEHEWFQRSPDTIHR
jgi:phosphatidylglycerophosphatase A